jgi:hypothetical protein
MQSFDVSKFGKLISATFVPKTKKILFVSQVSEKSVNLVHIEYDDNNRRFHERTKQTM